MNTHVLHSPLLPTLDILRVPPTAVDFPMAETTPDVKTASDEQLVAFVLADATHYTELVLRYEAPLDRYIRRLGVKVVEDRQDVLQEIFLKAYRNLNSFDQGLKFSSWLYRVAHNEAISFYRKQSVRPEGHLISDSETTFLFLEALEQSPERLTSERLNAESLQKGLAHISEKYRAVIVLRFFEHKEYEEISDILQIPLGTVGTLIHRGKQQLRRQLAETSIDI